jgi:transcription elongation GreA/GreB family factor
MVELWPRASAGLLDRIATAALAAGMTEQVQAFINAALENPAGNPETLYWLWKGGARDARLTVPSPKDLFVKILDTLSALGRTLNAPADVVKQFRNRMKTALGLRDYAMVKACLEQIGAEQAVTIRGQLERLDGIGENARGAMIELLRKVHPLLWVKPVKRLAAWEDEGVVWTTAEGLRRKSDERDHLMNVTMRENAKRIGEAAAMGDLSENSEYKFALEERDLLRARLAQMNNELSLARVIEPSAVDAESVGVGTRVRMRDVSSGAERSLTFLGPFDGDVEKGIFNYRAPVSQKLMGLRVGERVNLTLDGREAEYEIVEIANALKD